MRHGLFLLLILPVLACAGTPDLREVELHQAYGVTLRWDNVEQTPGRVAGIKPRKPLGAALHTVHLAPGQWVEVQLSADSRFRLHPVNPAGNPLPLQFETSSGSGLYVQQQPGNLPNGDLLLDPQGSTPWLVRVSLEASADRDVEFALFSSRLIELPAVEPYRYRQDIGLRDEHVRYAGDPGAQLFSHLRAGETIELSVEGPVRYRLQQRLLLTGKNHSLRHYQLRYRLDDGVMQVVDASVSTARRRQVLLNGEAVSASNLRNDYIEIPEGRHRLHLQFSEGVLLRLLKSLPDDYLLPGLNAPTHHYPAPATSDAWSLTPQQLQSILQPGNPLPTVQQSIMRMIVDNRRRGGGLVGPMTLMAIARSQPDAPALLNEAQVLLNRHSYYDDLLPATTHGKSQQRHFAQRRIREAQEGNDHYLLSTAESGELADKLETAWFTDLTDQGGIDFNLPERPADSLLRIVILDHALPARLQLYLDNQPPLPLRLDNASTPDLVHYRVDASRALAALAAQTVQANHDSSWQLPVQQTRPAAVLEVPLPRQVKNIRILRGDDGQRPVSLALQYRTARPYRLSDSSYLHLLEVLRKDSLLQPLWRACLTNIDTALNPDAALPGQLLAGQTVTENARSAARAVVNHWVPLLRWLRARQESYRAGIDTGEQPARRNIPTRELNDILTSAKRAERAGHWLPALENWRRLSDSKQVQHRQAALTGSVRALLKLGEYPLAERLLRGSYLSDTPSAMQTLRFEQAYTLYRQQNNSIALEGLLATELSRSQDPQRLSELVVQLVDAGRLKEALGAGMLLPAENRPHHKLLAVALKRHAWEAFETLLADIDKDTERALWQGYRAWALDDPETARRHWKMAGSVGATLLQKSREGQHLLTALLHGDKPQRTLATQRLAEWLPQLPGPTVWQPATGRLNGHAGMAWLYSPGLDLGFNTLRARPGQPLQLRIAGPLRLRFDIQPLHDKDQDLPLDGWLRVQSDTQTWISPFTGNRASTTLRWPGSQLRPGRIERRELQLPAGMHQLEISGIDRELLVRLSVEAPLLDLGLSQPAALPPTPARDWRQLARDTTCTRADKNGFVDCQADKTPRPVAGALEQQAINTDALTVELSDTEGRQWHHTRPAPLKSLSPVPQQGDPASRPLTPYQTMVSRLWQLEKSGADANDTITEMETLTKSVQQQPQASFMRPLLKRATRGADWQTIDYVPESAGVRYVERPANVPESPALRARAALLGDECNNSRLLSGHDELVYTLYNLKPATLRLELIPCSLPFEIPVPLQVRVKNEGKPDTELSLSRDTGTRSLNLHTGRGEHIIRLAMTDPAINQFLGVRIHDPAAAEQDTVERIYHLATHDEPLRFDIEGPAWLRVDELRDTQSFSRYIAVEDGWQSIHLQPDNDHDEALYRLYRRSAGIPPPPSRMPQAVETTTPVPESFRIALPPRAPSTIQDDYPLGGQEDGTSSIGLRLVSRTRVDDEEGSRRLRFRENFAELRAEHRYFDATNNRYWRSEILARLREDGDPVLGFGQHLYHWPLSRWPRLQVSANLTGFIQSPGDALPGKASGTEWTVNANTRALLHIPVNTRTYHEPALTLFGRAMSLNRNNRYAGASLDRDVFSRYKAQHKGGIRLSDYLLHKPWTDTEWYGQLAVTSNEDFNLASPDNLETRVGWRQLIGDTDIDVGYRLRHYLSDNDRARSSTRNDLRLKVNWMRWNLLQQRAELNLFLNYDIDNNENSVFVNLFLHGGNGRGLRDFRQSDVRFPDLRQRNAPHSANRVSSP